jgi:serine/threonine protein kinase
MKCIEPDRERTASALEERGKLLISKLCANTAERRACLDEFNELDKPALRQGDPNNTYHIGGPILCTPDIGPNPENTILRPPNNCAPAAGSPRKDILIFEDGGQSLKAYRDSPNKNVPVIIKGFRNLFKGISIFNNRNFFHNDIKPDNLTVGIDPLNNPKFRFIDFGISFSYPEVNPQMYDYSYAWWPLDSKILLPEYPQLSNTFNRRAPMRAIISKWLNDINSYCPSIVNFYKNQGLDGSVYNDIPTLANAMSNIMEPLYNGRQYRIREIVSKIDVFSVAASLLDAVDSEIRQGTPLGVAIRNFFMTSQILNVDSNIRPDARTFSVLYNNFVSDLIQRRLV